MSSQVYPGLLGVGSVSIADPLSGFGELETVTPTPTSQVAFVSGLNPLLTTTDTFGAGASVTATNGEAVVTSGTATTGYARLTSKKVAKYRAGQATMAKWTARFTAGSNGNQQMAGLYNIEAGYQFGYRNTVFGILYTETATVEVQTLTITTKASSATNVTVTLDGGPSVTAPVTNGANTSVTAAEIAAVSYATAAGGWDANAVGNVVYFTRKIAGPAGASTFNAGTSGAVGTFGVLTLGVAPTEQFIPQSTWNVDRMDGGQFSPSKIVLDPTKGNVYGVQFQYLGYGNAYFYIVDGSTGRPVLVHQIKNANTRTSTVLRNPNLYLTWESKNTGTGTSVTMYGASGGAFVEGPIEFLGAQFGVTATRTVGAAAETPVLSIRASTVYLNRLSTAQLQIDRFSVACDGTKTVDFKVYKNATLTAPQFARVNASSSATDYDSAATAITIGPGSQVYAFSVNKTGNATESVTDLALFMQAGDVLTITAYSVNASDVSASIIWVEDI